MTDLERIAEEDKRSAARAEAMKQALREMRGMWDELNCSTAPPSKPEVRSERSKRGLSVKFHLTPEEFPKDEEYLGEDLSEGYSSEEVAATESIEVRS